MRLHSESKNETQIKTYSKKTKLILFSCANNRIQLNSLTGDILHTEVLHNFYFFLNTKLQKLKQLILKSKMHFLGQNSLARIVHGPP